VTAEFLLVGLGAVLAYGGVLLGIARERARKPKSPKPPRPREPICGCGHDLAMHDPADQRCHERAKLMTYESPMRETWKLIPCPCRQYSGPRPTITG